MYARKDLGSVIAVMMLLLWSAFLNVFQHVSFPWPAKLPSLHLQCMEGWQGSDWASEDHSVLAGERGEGKGRAGQRKGGEGCPVLTGKY